MGYGKGSVGTGMHLVGTRRSCRHNGRKGGLSVKEILRWSEDRRLNMAIILAEEENISYKEAAKQLGIPMRLYDPSGWKRKRLNELQRRIDSFSR